MIWMRWNWLDNGLMPLLLATLRACWLWPWLALLSSVLSPQYGLPPLGFLAIIALPILSFAAARGLAGYVERRLPQTQLAATRFPFWARLLMALLGLIAILFMLWWQFYRGTYALSDGVWIEMLGDSLVHWQVDLPPQVLTLIAVAYLWLRGMLDAAKQLSHDDVWSTFVSGALAWALYLVLTHLGGVALDPYATILVVSFFALGMAGLAFTSLKITVGLDRALGMDRNRPARQASFNRYWLLSVVTVIVVLISLGLLIGALVAPDTLARVLDLARTLLGYVGYLIGQVLIVVGYVLFVIAYYIALLLRPLFQRLLALLFKERPPEEMQALEPAPTPQASLPEPVDVPDSYRWAGLALIVLVILVVFALALRRLRAAESEETDEVRESILTAELLQSQFGGLLRGWLDRLRGGGVVSPFLSLDGETDSRRAIRQVYQDLLAATAGQGQPRERSQTPTHFGVELGRRYARHAQALVAITEAYLFARYAPEAPPLSVAEQTQTQWAAMRGDLTGIDEDRDGDSQPSTS
ncbi:MAG: DUF4129 domain-containing protein [Caldilineaceae bacterium]|nr:DUF4129 domain-containing protein [Caldilineaceae bacterium]